MSDEDFTLYVCRTCFSVAQTPGPCPLDHGPRLRCDPGEPGNNCRKPPMDAEGRLLSRAPLWWVLRGAPYLRDRQPNVT